MASKSLCPMGEADHGFPTSKLKKLVLAAKTCMWFQPVILRVSSCFWILPTCQPEKLVTHAPCIPDSCNLPISGLGKCPILGISFTSPKQVSVGDYIPNIRVMWNIRTLTNPWILCDIRQKTSITRSGPPKAPRFDPRSRQAMRPSSRTLHSPLI